jgi:asparagine synthase (glutamine-hydrolysing)
MFVDRNGTRAPQCYWNLAEKFAQKQHYASANEAAEALNALLDDAVRLRLISDVPLGAFLSGGMDSSSIIAAMCRLRAAHMNRTFSIGFREKTYSELPNARAVADFLDVSHHDRTVVENMAEKLPRILAFTGEPFADSSIIPMFFLAKFAREHVTVALSGDGGDELFAGYDTYAADKLHPWLSWLPGSFARNMRTAVQSLLPVRFSKVSTDYKIRKFLDGISYDRRRAHYSWRTIFSNTEKRALLKPGWQRIQPEHDPFCIFRRHFNQVNNCPFLDQCMYVDIKTWMVDDILVKVDRATMAHGLEARAPILDYRLVEFAAGLPVELKLRGWDRKYILKHSQQQILPQDVLARAKRGFNAPVAHWMETSLEIFYRQLLDSTRENSSPFNTGFVRQLWDEHRAHRYDNSLKLLSLMNFQLWHKAHQERIKQNQYA